MRICLLSFLLSVLVHVAPAQSQDFVEEFTIYLINSGLTQMAGYITTVRTSPALDPTQATYFTLLSDTSTPKTIFAPIDYAFGEDPNNTNFYPPNNITFMAGMLLLHLVNGTFDVSNISAGFYSSILETEMYGHNLSTLENNRPQAIVCGVNTTSDITIYNQHFPNFVYNTTTFGHLTVHTIAWMLDLPGSFDFTVSPVTSPGVNAGNFTALQQAVGADLTNTQGYTVFLPSDSAFAKSGMHITTSNAKDIYNNHVITGLTVYSSDIMRGSQIPTSDGGQNFSFDYNSNGLITITSNSVKATFLRSDVTTDNGVIHIIDNILWDTSSEIVASPTGSGSLASGMPSATGSASTTPAANSVPMRHASVSLGTIIGIIAVAVVVLGVIIALFVWKRRRQTKQVPGTKELGWSGDVVDVARPPPHETHPILLSWDSADSTSTSPGPRGLQHHKRVMSQGHGASGMERAATVLSAGYGARGTKSALNHEYNVPTSERPVTVLSAGSGARSTESVPSHGYEAPGLTRSAPTVESTAYGPRTTMSSVSDVPATFAYTASQHIPPPPPTLSAHSRAGSNSSTSPSWVSAARPEKTPLRTLTWESPVEEISSSPVRPDGRGPPLARLPSRMYADMPDHVVDRLLERLAQRVDNGAAPQEDLPPPLYQSP